MNKVAGVLISAGLAFGSGCSAETMESSDMEISTRNPLALNYKIEQSMLDESDIDPRFAAGASYAIAQLCVQAEIVSKDTLIEVPPAEYRYSEVFTVIYEKIINGESPFGARAMFEACTSAQKQINSTV